MALKEQLFDNADLMDGSPKGGIFTLSEFRNDYLFEGDPSTEYILPKKLPGQAQVAILQVDDQSKALATLKAAGFVSLGIFRGERQGLEVVARGLLANIKKYVNDSNVVAVNDSIIEDTRDFPSCCGADVLVAPTDKELACTTDSFMCNKAMFVVLNPDTQQAMLHLLLADGEWQSAGHVTVGGKDYLLLVGGLAAAKARKGQRG